MQRVYWGKSIEQFIDDLRSRANSVSVNLSTQEIKKSLIIILIKISIKV